MTFNHTYLNKFLLNSAVCLALVASRSLHWSLGLNRQYGGREMLGAPGGIPYREFGLEMVEPLSNGESLT